MEKSYKDKDGKIVYELDFTFIKEMAKRMNKNKFKYEPYNWKKEMDINDIKNSLFRHCLEIMNDEYSDDGEEYGHIVALAINSMILLYQLKTYKNG